MNPSQRNAALVFLAAIALVAISSFAHGKSNLIFSILIVVLAILLIIGIAITQFRRFTQMGRQPATLRPRMLGFCGIMAIGYFALTEFTDVQCRRLVTFTQAVNAAQNSPEVNHLLGSPIRVSWPVKAGNGSNLSNEPGATHLLIPLSGTQGYAKLVADGVSVAGTWQLTNLQLVQNTTVTPLLSAPTAQ